jgi:DNA-binding MarR family transcriptional regulator
MSTPRWLDADEQKVWRSFLTASQAVFEGLDRQLQRDSGMPHAYYEILVRLSEAEGRTLRMRDLAARSSYSRSRLSHAVSRLETAGWVQRVECDTDRRGFMAVLTDDGFAALAAAAPGHVNTVRSLVFDPLTDEQVRQLGAIAEAILTGAAGAECETEEPAA